MVVVGILQVESSLPGARPSFCSFFLSFLHRKDDAVTHATIEANHISLSGFLD